MVKKSVIIKEVEEWNSYLLKDEHAATENRKEIIIFMAITAQLN